ncbi:TonB-dependent receptor plug domain-containing protein [Vibrio mangrovi]|uniref:Colicin I receptor n=1 Tax=Vibrio mangrovi TaxID=474394 RepID=A0A1Y6IW47_9VIBR|nr:TonB-dependent receptor [Vibrio mangrovi]MDW6002584.1 TonB-dependent receptor [Vibrio mangrovi]SMS01884.1 Colicin I receptor precursor [Vibrio mangrovi]
MKLLKISYAVATALTVNAAIAAENGQSVSSDVMVVTATSNQMSLQDAPASVSVVTNEEINRLPATDVATVLENVSGLRVIRSSGSEPYVVIRGLHNSTMAQDNYTLLLVNGRRINSSETLIRGAGFDFSSIPMSAIDHVEVIRGPMSALYGSDALGGVVNVILKKPTEETRVNASVSYSQPQEGDGTLQKANAFISGSAIPEKLHYTTAVEISDLDTWFPDDVTNASFTGNAEQERRGINTELSWLVNSSNKVLLNLGYLRDDRTFPRTDKYDTSDDTVYNSEKLTTSLGHQGLWSWGSTDLNYLYEHSEIDSYNPRELPTPTANAKQNNHTIDGQLAITTLDKQIITTGFDIAYTSINIDRNYNGSRSATQDSLYLQDQIELTEALAATLSGRFTNHNQFGSDFTPRAYLVYGVTDRFTLKGGYAEGFKTPTIYQSSEDFSMASCGGSCELTGNSNIQPQESKSYEFSGSYQADRWFIQATAFFNQIDEMIYVDRSTRATGFISYKNRDGDVESKGLELEGEFDLTDSLYLTANATYTHTKNKLTDLELANTPRWLANANITWTANDELSMFAGLNFTGSQKDEDQEGDSNHSKLSAYAVTNIGASYRLTDQFTIKTGITNLLDKRLDKTDEDYEENLVGRSYYLTVNYDM